jgi:hypothetical protein
MVKGFRSLLGDLPGAQRSGVILGQEVEGQCSAFLSSSELQGR